MRSKVVREPIATWYKAQLSYKASIEKVSVVSFTQKSITFLFQRWGGSHREMRQLIESHDHKYAPTFDEAKDWLLREAETKARHARQALDKAESLLESAKGLKENGHGK